MDGKICDNPKQRGLKWRPPSESPQSRDLQEK